MQATYPLISIIIPVYNVEPYLRRCLDSVINQTYKNLEIILVDDGSTDKSGEICEEYKKKDSRIIVIHQKNQGLSAARNAGLDIFKGDYVSFIDSDDYVDSRFIEILFGALDNYNADISACSVISIFNHNKKNILNLRDGIFDYREDLGLAVWNKLYLSSFFKKIRFPVGKFHEDSFIHYSLLSQAGRVACTSKCLYYYDSSRICSISHCENEKRYADLIEGMLIMIDFAVKNGVNKKIINGYFRYVHKNYVKYKDKFNKHDKKIKRSFKKIKKIAFSKLSLVNKICVFFPVLTLRFYYLLKNKMLQMI